MPATIPISLKVWGDYACFTSPETRVERVSYPVMTPSAARGTLEAVFWKPQIMYEIERIQVLNPIRFTSIRRNEIQGTVTVKGKSGVNAWMKDPSGYQPYLVDSAGRDDVQGENRTQRNSVILKDVAYIIEASLIVKKPTPNDTPAKYREMFTRRADRGQCVRQPCLGIREFAAYFAIPDGSEAPIRESRDLGIMLYDLDFPASKTPGLHAPEYALFAPAKLENGILNVSDMRQNLYRRA
ncbi:type I-C CRISPR-associated protein Cas5c [Pelagicoccus sp. SDUM812003]|uniref:type I-C CRISPR-associated protein Cas5c n=1 Tax=Pelagicoccus sp. SDUM812003 TaxID=3041267 RepID=UPI00280D8479|nr:type I-C CRISPR-associated protein Cas5c [Pelagicoccus sp. SDUM812003]MDQ8201755.1 type I-C CRISPR-associated protein Cas5c [Pelagicoccus sp. SDUM812003]